MKAAYEHAAHNKMALSLGFTKEQLADIDNGKCPKGMSEDEKVAWEVTTEMLTVPGPLKQSVYDRGVEVLGKEGMTVLIQYIGFYRYVATILNGFDVQVPEKEKQEGY